MNIIQLLYDYRDYPDFSGVKNMSVNVIGCFNNQPIHLACSQGDLAAVKLLLRHGADVNALGDANCTPLHKAILMQHLDVVDFLLQNNAVTNVVNNDGNNAVDQALLMDGVHRNDVSKKIFNLVNR